MKNRIDQADEHLLDINETAQLLNFSRSYIYQKIKEGKLRAISFGAHLRIRRRELERFIRERERGDKAKKHKGKTKEADKLAKPIPP